jgi:hypothetical protein
MSASEHFAAQSQCGSMSAPGESRYCIVIATGVGESEIAALDDMLVETTRNLWPIALASGRRARPTWAMSAFVGRRHAGAERGGEGLTPLAVFGSIHATCLSASVTDCSMERWYHPSIA